MPTVNQLLLTLPSPEEIRQLPRFQNLSFDHIILIRNLEECQKIEFELKKATVLGFDTESKPTFKKGEISTGPHLIQLASFEKAYLFQVNDEILEFLAPIFSNIDQFKVGFGLKNDAHLFRKKGLELKSTIELSKCFGSFGFQNSMGIKNATALLFHVHFQKNKKISTSNWSKKILSPEQISYAAADAYAALLVFAELFRRATLPIEIIRTIQAHPKLIHTLSALQ